MNRQTYQAKAGDVEQQWLHVDAKDLILGRLATKIAVVLMGKHKPQYTPHCDTGDFVVVTNVEKIILTGNKLDTKMFQRYSGYPSGLRQNSYRWMIENQPEEVLTTAVRRMLPKNKLASKMLTKLKVYRGESHPHQAQQPQPLSI